MPSSYGLGPTLGFGEALPPEPHLERESTDANGRTELLQDPQVVALATSMPTRLIEPRANPEAGGTSTLAWGVDAVQAARSEFSGHGVVVAVLDTGIDSAHEAFGSIELVPKDFSGGEDCVDRCGHGTHCAGTIFGKDVDGTRIGVARGVTKALIGKVLADDGNGSSDMLFEGLAWASAQGANVISMSLGFDFPGMVRTLTEEGWPVDLATSSALEAYRGNLRMFEALMEMIGAREMYRQGTVVVAAAGNESRRDVSPTYTIAASLPAAATGVVSVGAAARGERGLSIGAFSNTFPQIAAPGVDILSAKAGGGLVSKTGTSMACPYVAGVAALWWEAVRIQGLPLHSEMIVAKLLGGARTEVFTDEVGAADRGSGLVTAP